MPCIPLWGAGCTFMWFMKRLTLLSGFIILSSLSVAQLDNNAFIQQTIVNQQDSGVLALRIDGLGFLKNNEYFNDIADGYTLFGYQLSPYVSYQPLESVSISLGAYLQRDFGSHGYKEVDPTFTVKYQKNGLSVLFGTLDGAFNHKLIEPIYDFEKVLTDPLENGFQIRLDKKRLFADVWVDWRNMIYPGEDDQEEVTGGISFNYKIVDREDFTLGLPVQFFIFHRGGQIDTSDAPLQTYSNSAVGISLLWKEWHGFITGLESRNYFVSYIDHSPEQIQTYQDGYGLYLNLTAKTKVNLDIMVSYWSGNEFASIQGGRLYPSVSGTVKNPFYTEEDRDLLIFRFLHNLKLSEDIVLSTRFEPFYDLNNNTFEFSHGFYVNYNLDFVLKK